MVICDHSELLQTISDLELENKQLRKQDKHREKTWKKRVTEMQRKNADLLEAVEDMDYTKKLRAKITELEKQRDEAEQFASNMENWITRAEAAEAKVAELEAQAIDLKDEWADEAFECSEAEGNAKYYKAKVAELRKENDDLMTLAIPELQLDLKDAQAKITAVHVWYSKRGDWQELARILKENRDE